MPPARVSYAALCSALALCLFGGCASPSSKVAAQVATRGAPEVSGWPEADQRFRPAGPWLGADSAYSIDLSAGRVLWLFGDTFLDPTRDGSRVNGPNFFVRNTVALQQSAGDKTAYDLSRAELTFVAGAEREGVPSSYFPETPEGDWFWPLHGARLADGKLLLFRLRVAKVSTGFGFKVRGWQAVAIDDPGAPLSAWQPRLLAEESDAARLVGASVLVSGDYAYLYAVKNQDDDHAIYLARVSVRALSGLSEAALSELEWYTARGFERLSRGATPEVVLADGQIEFSVHYEPRLQRFVQIQMRGLFVSEPRTAIVMRSADRPEGPWSGAIELWKPSAPQGADPSKLLAYAAKAHPEQRGADLVLSYVMNDVAHTPPIDAVYYPELLRVRLGR